MKKMFVFLLFLILIISTYSSKPLFYDLFCLNNLIFKNISYSIYCLDVYEDIKNAEIINLGNGYIIKTNINNSKKVKSKSSNILGESVRFETSYSSIEKIIKYYDIEILKEEKIGEVYSLYGYIDNKSFPKKIYDGENIINIQIAFVDSVLTIGYPIILGDY